MAISAASVIILNAAQTYHSVIVQLAINSEVTPFLQKQDKEKDRSEFLIRLK